MKNVKYEIIKTSLGTVRKITNSDFYVLTDIIYAVGLSDTSRTAKRINQQYIKKLDFKAARQYGLAPGYRGIFLVNKEGIKQFSGITSHKLKVLGLVNELNLNDDMEVKSGIESFEGHKIEYIELNGEMLYEVYSTAVALKQTNRLSKECIDKYVSENDIKLFNYNGQRYLTKAMLSRLAESMLSNNKNSDYQIEFIEKEVKPMEINNQIEIFENNEFGQIRTILKDGEPWFVGKDAAKCLGYSKLDAMYRIIDEEDKIDINPQSKEFQGFPQNGATLEPNKNVFILKLINESGLYQAIFSSKLQTAKKFKHWVTSEVLPSIRQTGGYIQQGKEEKFINNYFSNLSEETKKMMIRDLQNKNEELENKGIEIARQIKSNNEVLIELKKGGSVDVK